MAIGSIAARHTDLGQDLLDLTGLGEPQPAGIGKGSAKQIIGLRGVLSITRSGSPYKQRERDICPADE